MAKVDVSKFIYIEEYLNKDIELILNAIYGCYDKIINSKIPIPNNENLIRDIFTSTSYLDNNTIKKEFGVNEYKFDRETTTDNGRADIRVFNMPRRMDFDDEPYYYIECKRIDGGKVLNELYLSNGVNRYIEEKYPVHNFSNGMIGFVTKRIDIDSNSVVNLKLVKHVFVPKGKHTYLTKHKTKKSKKSFSLFHLMFDFSSCII